MSLFLARMQFRPLVVVLLLAAALLLPRASAQGTAGPGGVNIGLDFNWPGGIARNTASFIETGGTSVNNCSGPSNVTTSTAACSFPYAYSIGGVAQTGVASGGAYETWSGAPTASGVFCDATFDTAPLTLFQCFNENSFGQIFIPSVSGSLTAFSMRMTCLNPAGTAPTGLFALIYQMTGNGLTLPAVPLNVVPVDLSACPLLTTWEGHTFTSSDFATIPLNFTGVTLTAGNIYGVYFGGLTPGQQPPGAPPTVTSVTPNSGAPAGGTSVTIAGSGFTGATSVTFGGTAATNVTVVSATSITATTPSHALGAVSVLVTTPAGTNSANTLYTYAIPVPTVTSVSPTSGPPGGGTAVTITGTGFTGATSVTFGGTAATNVTVVSATSITATTPAHALGAVSVLVTTPGGTNTANTLYTYSIPVPTVTSVSPTSGPPAGGTTVTITGTGFTGATSVTFGGTAATGFAVLSATSITASTPAHAVGAVSVLVTTPGGTNTANTLYTYAIPAPTITSVTPSSGPPAGGNVVTITGTGFTGATSVTFGGTPAAAFTVVSATEILATVPSGAAGSVNVAVTTPGGTSSSTAPYSFATPTPTLSEWGMIALAILLALFGWFKLRQPGQTAAS